MMQIFGVAKQWQQRSFVRQNITEENIINWLFKHDRSVEVEAYFDGCSDGKKK
jgi:hypothetical protein